MTLESRLGQILPANREYLNTFRRHKLLAGLSERTVTNYTEHVMRYLKYNPQDLKLTTRDNIEEFALELRRDASVSTAWTVILAMRVFFADLLGKDAEVKLFDGIRMKRPTVRVRDDELLSSEEIKRMISVCRTERDRALISLLYASGCRCGELMGLKLRDIQFTRFGAAIHVNGKTGERDVDVFDGVPELKAWINVHPHHGNPDAPVWVRLNGDDHMKPLDRKSVWRLLQRTAERAGIPETKRWNPHAFRHKRATDCAEIMTTADLKVMLGWSQNSDMASVYVHSSRQRVAEKLMGQAGIKVPKQLTAPAPLVKQCPVCSCTNSGNALICVCCGAPLDEQMAFVDKGIRDFLRDHMDEILAYKKECEEKSKKEDSET